MSPTRSTPRPGRRPRARRRATSSRSSSLIVRARAAPSRIVAVMGGLSDRAVRRRIQDATGGDRLGAWASSPCARRVASPGGQRRPELLLGPLVHDLELAGLAASAPRRDPRTDRAGPARPRRAESRAREPSRTPEAPKAMRIEEVRDARSHHLSRRRRPHRDSGRRGGTGRSRPRSRSVEEHERACPERRPERGRRAGTAGRCWSGYRVRVSSHSACRAIVRSAPRQTTAEHEHDDDEPTVAAQPGDREEAEPRPGAARCPGRRGTRCGRSSGSRR